MPDLDSEAKPNEQFALIVPHLTRLYQPLATLPELVQTLTFADQALRDTQLSLGEIQPHLPTGAELLSHRLVKIGLSGLTTILAQDTNELVNGIVPGLYVTGSEIEPDLAERVNADPISFPTPLEIIPSRTLLATYDRIRAIVVEHVSDATDLSVTVDGQATAPTGAVEKMDQAIERKLAAARTVLERKQDEFYAQAAQAYAPFAVSIQIFAPFWQRFLGTNDAARVYDALSEINAKLKDPHYVRALQEQGGENAVPYALVHVAPFARQLDAFLRFSWQYADSRLLDENEHSLRAALRELPERARDAQERPPAGSAVIGYYSPGTGEVTFT